MNVIRPVLLCGRCSEEPVSQEYEEEEKHYHNGYLGGQGGPQVEVMSFLSVLLGAQGQSLGLVT